MLHCQGFNCIQVGPHLEIQYMPVLRETPGHHYVQYILLDNVVPNIHVFKSESIF